MAARIGIELSPSAWRVVELDVIATRGKPGPMATRVRRFDALRPGDPETAAALASLRRRDASVIVWGAPGDHRQVMVTAGRYEAMRAEATRSLGIAGVETRRALVDIARAPLTLSAAPGSDARSPATRRPVVAALASGIAVRAAIQPLLAAGIHVCRVATPATALTSLARLHRTQIGRRSEWAIEAYIALEEMATCITVLRGGTLVAARELSWGFAEGRRGDLRRAEDVAGVLADELGDFLATIGGSLGSIDRAVLCGGFPDLRGVAGLLHECSGVEVEPLDALFAIDQSGTPAACRERAADLRMAWAVAADAAAPLNLLHSRQRHAAQTRFARAAVAAGIIAGVGLGWGAAQSILPHASTPRPAAERRPSDPTIGKDAPGAIPRVVLSADGRE